MTSNISVTIMFLLGSGSNTETDMDMIRRLLPYVLVLPALVFTAWGTLGIIEYFFPAVAFGLQNAMFPTGTQFLYWVSILGFSIYLLQLREMKDRFGRTS